MREGMADRALHLLAQANLKDLAQVNSKEYVRWQSIKRGRARFALDDLEQLLGRYPQHRWWVLTGETLTATEQTHPTTRCNDQPAGDTSADRARALIKLLGPRKTSAHGGSYERWRSVSKGAVRVSSEEIDVLVKLYPQYALWLVTGKQTVDIEQKRPDEL